MKYLVVAIFLTYSHETFRKIEENFDILLDQIFFICNNTLIYSDNMYTMNLILQRSVSFLPIPFVALFITLLPIWIPNYKINKPIHNQLNLLQTYKIWNYYIQKWKDFICFHQIIYSWRYSTTFIFAWSSFQINLKQINNSSISTQNVTLKRNLLGLRFTWLKQWKVRQPLDLINIAIVHTN
jgi:hypothetical protein